MECCMDWIGDAIDKIKLELFVLQQKSKQGVGPGSSSHATRASEIIDHAVASLQVGTGVAKCLIHIEHHPAPPPIQAGRGMGYVIGLRAPILDFFMGSVDIQIVDMRTEYIKLTICIYLVYFPLKY